jgi:hypothetical protein
MKAIRTIIAAAALSAFVVALTWAPAEEVKKSMPDQTTVEWVCATWPDRVKKLLEQLDLARTGLQDGQTIVSTDADAGNLRIAPAAAFNWTTALVTGQEKPHLQGWYSPKYNQWEPNTTAVMTADVEGATAFAWLLLPARGTVGMAGGEIIENTADVIRIRVRMPGGQAFTVRIPWRQGKPTVD